MSMLCILNPQWGPVCRWESGLLKDTQNIHAIIFCRQYSKCAQMYNMFEQLQGTEFTDLPGTPSLVKYQQVEIYTKCKV